MALRSRTVVDESVRIQYAAVYVLHLLKNSKSNANALIAKGEEILAPVLQWLVSNDYGRIGDNDTLEATAKGADVVAQFEERYQRFLRDYDVFCAVDLQAGEFALEHYHAFPHRDEWDAFLSEERWDDLRIAVAEHQGIDSIDIVFMGFLQDGRFGVEHNRWDYDRLLGSVWDEISNICNNALRVEDLAYNDGGSRVSGQQVIEDIIRQGSAVIQEVRNP